MSDSNGFCDRHSHQGKVAFFDGHVELEPLPFAHDIRYNEPLH